MKNLICALLALAMVPALFACGKQEAPAAADPTEILAETTAMEESTAEEVPAEETTISPEETLEGETTAAAPHKPSTAAEIVAYYNDAANKVKTEKPGYSFTEQTRINSMLGGAKGLSNLISKAIADDTPQADTIAEGADHKAFAVPGKDWSSKLAASMVKSATCVEKDGLYEIRINMKTESRPDLPGNVEEHDHGKAFKIYDRGKIYGVMAGYESWGRIDKFAPTYHDCYLVCSIDKATGSMKSAAYYLTFGAAIEGKLASFVPLKASADISVTGKYVF